MVNLEVMDFKSYLEKSARQIDDQLDEILSEFLNETKKTNIKLLPLALGFLNSCKGGKRIRGTLVKLGYELSGGVPTEEILKISAAIEILHSAILIHDDIIDKSATRRGQKTLYKVLGGDHYGISQAITIGDIGLYLPIKIITEANFLGEYKIKVLSSLSQIVVNTGWGQIMDVESHFAEASRDKGFVDLYKTAKYTVVGPLQIGAILAGADDNLIRELGEFGDSLGIAFQIKDDILDNETTSPDLALTKALEYASKAKKVIPKLTKDPKMSKLLQQLAEYLTERTK